MTKQWVQASKSSLGKEKWKQSLFCAPEDSCSQQNFQGPERLCRHLLNRTAEDEEDQACSPNRAFNRPWIWPNPSFKCTLNHNYLKAKQALWSSGLSVLYRIFIKKCDYNKILYKLNLKKEKRERVKSTMIEIEKRKREEKSKSTTGKE